MAKALDAKQIARKALSSHPPRAADVPAQVEFCKKHGGHATQQYVLDICAYAKAKGGKNIVGAHIFERVNQLPISDENNMPDLIDAIVKTAATRGGTREQISVHITDADNKSITGKRHQLCQEANKSMIRAEEITNELDSATTTRGDMECDMIEFIFENVEGGS